MLVEQVRQELVTGFTEFHTASRLWAETVCVCACACVC